MSDQESKKRVQFSDPNDDIGSNPVTVAPIRAVIATRLSRRTLLKGILAGAAVITRSGIAGRPGVSPASATEETPRSKSSLTFAELPHGVSESHAVAKGYDAQVLIRWGDPLFADAPPLDPRAPSAEDQERQFGYNNDYVAFMPLPQGPDSADRGLLCVNHEYTNTDLMFSGLTADNILERMTLEMVEVELAAHGHSVVEIKKNDEGWVYLQDSPYNRRLSMRSTAMQLSGPAAGHKRLKTRADPSGTRVIGTLNNCAGGKTPWGTVLIAEENFHLYFAGDPGATAEARNHERYGLTGEPAYPWWGKYLERFDIEREPNEPNRFGWVVEYDPYDPGSIPVKRTALGRMKHEGAGSAINKDGRLVIYTGDDERFDYVYKFVSSRAYDPKDRAANKDLLDDGTLYVGKFHDNGRLSWLPLVFGNGPLTAGNGFDSQADVLIETRRAADLLGATPMDRPEDVDPHPQTGVVYMALTNNTKRTAAQVDSANPRGPNPYGHLIAMIPPGAGTEAIDHAAMEFTWDLPILAGDPADSAGGAKYNPDTSSNGWFAAPDNVAFDSSGRLWIATDQGSGWQKTGFADGMYGCDVGGEGAYLTRHLFRVPIGAEMCGPEFTPDSTALFVAIQHPAADGTASSTFDAPATRWPDFREDMPPRPSVMVITKADGGQIGD